MYYKGLPPELLIMIIGIQAALAIRGFAICCLIICGSTFITKILLSAGFPMIIRGFFVRLASK